MAVMIDDQKNERNMSILHSPAECFSGCDDETCPYMHTEAWFVLGEDDGQEYGPFTTRAEAVECNKRHLLQEAQ